MVLASHSCLAGSWANLCSVKLGAWVYSLVTFLYIPVQELYDVVFTFSFCITKTQCWWQRHPDLTSKKERFSLIHHYKVTKSKENPSEYFQSILAVVCKSVNAVLSLKLYNNHLFNEKIRHGKAATVNYIAWNVAAGFWGNFSCRTQWAYHPFVTNTRKLWKSLEWIPDKNFLPKCRMRVRISAEIN